MDRDIRDVIEQIKQLTDEDFPRRTSLFRNLDSVVEHARYTAPEIMWKRWYDLNMVLAAELNGHHHKPWAQAIGALMRNEESN